MGARGCLSVSDTLIMPCRVTDTVRPNDPTIPLKRALSIAALSIGVEQERIIMTVYFVQSKRSSQVMHVHRKMCALRAVAGAHIVSTYLEAHNLAPKTGAV